MNKIFPPKRILLFFFCAFSPLVYSQNIGINTTGTTPSVNAILDLNTGNSNNLGIIIPNVTLGALLTTFNPPMANAPTAADVGMMVFNAHGPQTVGYYYWSGTQWISVSGGIATVLADNGLSIGSFTGGYVELGGTTATPSPLVGNSVISGSGFSLDFDLGTYSATGTGSFLITNGGVTNPFVSVNPLTATTAGVGINVNPAASTLDVNGSIATRETSVAITSNGQVVTVGNSSFIIMTSTGTPCTGAYSFSITNGQPGQELTLEMSSGNAYLPNIGNVKLSALASFGAYATLSLKWDNVNSEWVELSRNGLMSSSAPSSTYTFSWNGLTNYYTGSVQTLTVPACATSMTVTAIGGGAVNYSQGSICGTTQIAGLGASLTGTITVVPGDVLDIIVGGAGTDPECCSQNLGCYGASGGGGTYIWDATSSTLLVAAGGGGGAGTSAGGNNGQTNIGSPATLEAANSALGNCGAGGAGGNNGAQGTWTGNVKDAGAGGAGWSSSFPAGSWGNCEAFCPTCGPTPGQGGQGSTAAGNGYGGYGGGGGGGFNAGGGGGGYNGGGGGNGNNGGTGDGGAGGGSYWQGGVPTSSTTGGYDANGSVSITF